MVVQTPVMASLQVEDMKKKKIDPKMSFFQSNLPPKQTPCNRQQRATTTRWPTTFLYSFSTSLILLQVPEVTLAVRPEPVTTPRPTTPAALYGAPPRRGRRGRRISQRRKRKQGRRVKNARSSRQIVFV